MRKIMELVVFALPVLILAIVVYILVNGKGITVSPQKPNGLTVSSQKIKPNNNDFEYFFRVFDDLSKLRLVDNQKMRSSDEVLKENNCVAAINGGFYDKNNEPLSLLISDGEIIAEDNETNLTNGYIWLSELGGFGVSDELPDSKFIFALGTGPLLYLNGEKMDLEIANDKMARRSVFGTLSDNSIFFLSIFDNNSVYLGPKLQNLPKMLDEISLKENWQIIDAINLDGGTASLYKDQENSLSEFKSVRSIFCLTK